MRTPYPGRERLDKVKAARPGKYVVPHDSFKDFTDLATLLDLKVSVAYNYSGPSKRWFAYGEGITYSLQVFDDGGLDFFDVQLA